MGARWYDAQINHWLAADRLVPDPAESAKFEQMLLRLQPTTNDSKR